VAPAVAGSALLFLAGLAFAWWALVPAALNFLVNYGADVVEPLWSIERYLDFVLVLMVATALAFQLPVLQLLLAALGLVRARAMLAAWRWVVLLAALAGAVSAAEATIQIHGGIGFTWEHPAHLLLRRAQANAVAVGRAETLRDRAAREVLAGCRNGAPNGGRESDGIRDRS
jgi:hypothetical protein